MSHNEYPKIFWVLTRAEVILEGDTEVVNHTTDQVVAGTFDLHVAERVAAIFKDNQSNRTMIMSDVNPLPSAVLNIIANDNDADVDVNKLMDMVQL